jgi:hypothetical protein
MNDTSPHRSSDFLSRLSRRGVLRVAASYAILAWLLLQIADVVLEPLGLGTGTMRVLMLVLVLGFPVAVALAWFFELTPSGFKVDHEPVGAPRPTVGGVRRYADVVIIGILVIVVAVLLARQGGLIEQVPEAPILAVLPFANMSPEAEDAFDRAPQGRNSTGPGLRTGLFCTGRSAVPGARPRCRPGPRGLTGRRNA